VTVAERIDPPHLYEASHKVPVELIRPNPANPRKDVTPDEGLIVSVRQIGIIEPLVLRRVDDEVHPFELLAGHRRLAAATANGFDRVPAVIRNLGDAEALEVMLVENLARRDLSPVEEARGMAGLADLGRTQRQIAELLGVSQPVVSKRLALLKLPEPALAAVEKGRDSGGITIEEAQALAALPAKKVAPLFDKGRAPDRYKIERAVRDHTRDKKIEAKKAECDKAGVKWVVGHTGSGPKGKARYSLKWLKGVDAKEHAKLPCHLVVISEWDGSHEPACNDPDSHRQDSEEKLSPAQREALVSGRLRELAEAKRLADQERAEQTADLREKGRERRVAFCRQAIAKAPSAQISLAEIIGLAAWVYPEVGDLDLQTSLEYLGVDPGSDWQRHIGMVQTYAGDELASQSRALYAMALVAAEGFVGNYGPVRDENLPVARRYIKHLAGLGYTLDELEGEIIAEQLELSVAGSPEVTIAKIGRARKWTVTCSEHGVLGTNTTEAFAEDRRTKHLRDDHNLQEAAS
jgi:ParB/RepB/Spo0J family partition protein